MPSSNEVKLEYMPLKARLCEIYDLQTFITAFRSIWRQIERAQWIKPPSVSIT